MEDNQTTSEQTSQPDSTKAPVKADKPKKKVSLAVFIVSLLLVLFAGSVAGYYIGATTKESELTDHYESEIDKINNNVDEAKDAASDDADQDQAEITKLENENSELQATVDQQEDKIAELEDELDEAQASNNSQSATPQ